jgi:hypothetical protein
MLPPGEEEAIALKINNPKIAGSTEAIALRDAIAFFGKAGAIFIRNGMLVSEVFSTTHLFQLNPLGCCPNFRGRGDRSNTFHSNSLHAPCPYAELGLERADHSSALSLIEWCYPYWLED